jgi:alpha-amylase
LEFDNMVVSKYRYYLLGVAMLFWLAACNTAGEPTEEMTSIPVPRNVPAVTSAPAVTAASVPAQPDILEADPEGQSDLYKGTAGMPWWNDAVFYELFVRSFQDSDGDGKGDIPGLIEKLDYLNDGDPSTTDDLGVTGIWLMPIMESPSYHGYDVVDYFKVDEEYGTEDDFKRLIDEAHDRGIRVVVDLVLNHTSSDHPWFQDAKGAESSQRDWYIWTEEDPGYRGPWGQQVWHYSGGEYFYGVFWEGMPDLNYENPEVTEAMLESARFWLEDMGADGFRLDAVKHIVEDGSQQENTDATHEWLEGFYTFYKDVNPDAFAVGEAWTSTDQVLEYTGDEVDVAFQFDLAQAILDTSSGGKASHFMDEMTHVVDSYPAGQYATFITNHDQDRVMSQLDGDEGAAKVAGSLLLTSPGAPFIYYGEEIGMTGMKPDENIRRPMQWSGKNLRVGFTSGSPWRRPSRDYEERNVDLQNGDPDSMLNHYRSLIQLRNDHEALRVGEWAEVDTGNESLVAFLRHTDTETLLILINASHEAISDYDLALSAGPLTGDASSRLLYGEGDLIEPEVNNGGGFSSYKPLEELLPQSTYIIEFD